MNYETSSQGTTQSSIYSIEEEEEEDVSRFLDSPGQNGATAHTGGAAGDDPTRIASHGSTAAGSSPSEARTRSSGGGAAAAAAASGEDSEAVAALRAELQRVKVRRRRPRRPAFTAPGLVGAGALPSHSHLLALPPCRQ